MDIPYIINIYIYVYRHVYHIFIHIYIHTDILYIVKILFIIRKPRIRDLRSPLANPVTVSILQDVLGFGRYIVNCTMAIYGL